MLVCAYSYSTKVVKAAAQVLNTLWQYRELRTLYKQVKGVATLAAIFVVLFFLSPAAGVLNSSTPWDKNIKLGQDKSQHPKVFLYLEQ